MATAKLRTRSPRTVLDSSSLLAAASVEIESNAGDGPFPDARSSEIRPWMKANGAFALESGFCSVVLLLAWTF